MCFWVKNCSSVVLMREETIVTQFIVNSFSEPFPNSVGSQLVLQFFIEKNECGLELGPALSRLLHPSDPVCLPLYWLMGFYFLLRIVLVFWCINKPLIKNDTRRKYSQHLLTNQMPEFNSSVMTGAVIGVTVVTLVYSLKKKKKKREREIYLTFHWSLHEH